MWEMISGGSPPDLQHLKIVQVHHPAIRVWFRLMAFTIWARSSTNITSTHEIAHLASYLSPEQGTRFDLALQLVDTLDSVARNASTQPILLGGLITQIAVWKCNYHCHGMPRGPTLLSIAHFESSRWFEAHDNQRWKLPNGATVLLPSTFTPALVPGRSDYLYPPPAYFVPAARPTCEPYSAPTAFSGASGSTSSQYYYREESYQHTAPSATPGPDPWSQVMTQIGTLQESFGRLQLDQQRALYPIYDDYYRMGKIPTDHTHPSWYNPPFAGTFGGEHGAGSSGAGGSGGRQGDDDDEDADDDDGEDIYDVDGSGSDE